MTFYGITNMYIFYIFWDLKNILERFWLGRVFLSFFGMFDLNFKNIFTGEAFQIDLWEQLDGFELLASNFVEDSSFESFWAFGPDWNTFGLPFGRSSFKNMYYTKLLVAGVNWESFDGSFDPFSKIFKYPPWFENYFFKYKLSFFNKLKNLDMNEDLIEILLYDYDKYYLNKYINEYKTFNNNKIYNYLVKVFEDIWFMLKFKVIIIPELDNIYMIYKNRDIKYILKDLKWVKINNIKNVNIKEKIKTHIPIRKLNISNFFKYNSFKDKNKFIRVGIASKFFIDEYLWMKQKLNWINYITLDLLFNYKNKNVVKNKIKFEKNISVSNLEIKKKN